MKTTKYDLMLLFDADISEGSRNEVVQWIEQTVAKDKAGSIVENKVWGTRNLPYRIKHRTDAYYHLLRLEAQAETLDALHRTLRITEGVLRFRIIKSSQAPAGTPAPSSPPAIAETDGESAPAAA